jgi:hypothetical protein
VLEYESPVIADPELKTKNGPPPKLLILYLMIVNKYARFLTKLKIVDTIVSDVS